MAKESRYDSYELIPPDVGLWETRSVVDDSMEYLASVTNMTLTEKKSLRTRFGFSTLMGSTIAGAQVRKFWVYETFSPASTTIHSYLIAAAEDQVTNLYGLYWLYAGSPFWAAVTSFRGCNSSTRIPLIVFSRGLAYVKTFPDAATVPSEKLGTVILDGTSGTLLTKPWGLLGPEDPVVLSGEVTKLTADVNETATTLTVADTTAFPAAPFPIWVGQEQMNVTAKPDATHLTVTRAYQATIAAKHRALTAVRYFDWSASDHSVTVGYGWKYTYAYKSITGAISNIAPDEYNPDVMLNDTGPFLDLIPKMEVQGLADTTNFPTIVIYRSTDGGGSYYLLEEITNTGSGAITYEDDSFGTGGSSTTYNDPVPDTKLNTFEFAPTQVSNSPPPTVVPPEVIGVDYPSKNSYAMCTHSRRIFFNVANYLYYSSYEELIAGIPEEAFSTDLAATGANYIAFTESITALASDTESLWIFTTKATYRLFGSTKDSFYVVKVFDVGARQTELNSAAASSNGQIAFIANSGAVFMISEGGNQLTRISDPMILTGSQALTLGSSFVSLYFYKTSTQEFLFLASTAVPNSATSEVYVYDVGLSKERRKPVWISRWSIGGTISAFGAFESYSAVLTGVFAGITNLANSIVTQMTESTSVAPTDLQVNGSSSSFSNSIITMPIRVPPGNHVNTYNRPTRDVKGTRIFTYSVPAGGTFVAPIISYAKDNSGGVVQLTAQKPPRVTVQTPGTYTIQTVPVDKDCYRLLVQISGSPGSYMELYGFAVEFEPHYTATEV